ncbi:MAG TPA: gamma-glutamylcyclotransferase family protein [Terriglobales bacterium]|nr:gamma-glutamylcyclotransferase family protein [Terriglobales bacterium]
MSDQKFEDSDKRLAVYGSLAPGKENHWVLASMNGCWARGVVRGQLHPEGWGATSGFPALVFDEDGPEVPVFVFESDELPQNWARLDEFEGKDYRRTVVPVKLDSGGFVRCCVYELNRQAK